MSLCLNCFISSIITHKLVIYIYIYIAWAWVYLLNKLESKVQAWRIYKPEKKKHEQAYSSNDQCHNLL